MWARVGCVVECGEEGGHCVWEGSGGVDFGHLGVVVVGRCVVVVVVAAVVVAALVVDCICACKA